jgi:hypothetical protein
LGIKARIKATVSVSFGLVATLLGGAFVSQFSSLKEVIMNNSNAVAVVVWCGVALLRSQVG